MNTDNIREAFVIPVILTKSFTDSFEAEKKNYAYEGKPLAWQQGFTKGFHEGYQAAHAASEKRIAELEEEKQNLKLANIDGSNWFDALKIDFDKLQADNKRLVEAIEEAIEYGREDVLKKALAESLEDK